MGRGPDWEAIERASKNSKLPKQRSTCDIDHDDKKEEKRRAKEQKQWDKTHKKKRSEPWY